MTFGVHFACEPFGSDSGGVADAAASIVSIADAASWVEEGLGVSVGGISPGCGVSF